MVEELDRDCTRNLPIRYNGLPLFSSRLKASLFQSLSKSRFLGKLLSFAGRFKLIKWVLHAYQMYWLAAFFLPVIEKMMIVEWCQSEARLYDC